MREFIKAVEPLYEMASLPPSQTGLSVPVWVSPRGGAQHDARIKVTMPPYGSHPEAIYQIRTFDFVEGNRWLNLAQEKDLAKWVSLNEKTLMDFWDGNIHYDDDLKSKLISINNAPPATYREAIIALRASASKVQSIWWHNGTYNLFFDRFLPSLAKISERFSALGFKEPIKLHKGFDKRNSFVPNS